MGRWGRTTLPKHTPRDRNITTLLHGQYSTIYVPATADFFAEIRRIGRTGATITNVSAA